MFKSYFKIAWRNLLKAKGYSAINIVGLATGMAVAMVIGLWIWDEASFNKYHRNFDRIAQVWTSVKVDGNIYVGSTIAMPMGNALRTKYGNEFKRTSLITWEDKVILGSGDKKMTGNARWVQQDFPEMFSLEMLKGKRDALKDPSTMLVCRSLAKSLFGNEDPINKTIKISNKFELKIGGVYEDLPHNTTFYNTQMLFPFTSKENWFNSESPQTNWNNHCGWMFVELNDNVDINKASAAIKDISTGHIKEYKESTLLYPMSRLHLHGEFDKSGHEKGGRIQFAWLFGIIGVFVLMLACINFMNLSTARSEKRAKEVGIRKAIGSLRKQLIGQFLSESLLVALLAFLLSIVIVQLSIPFFNKVSDKNMVIPWGNAWFWLTAAGFTFFTGLISGSYPAFYLSSFRPVKVLKGTFRAGRFASIPRKVLVVLQFTVSISLIIGTIIVFRQIQHAKDRPIGYTREGLITIQKNTPELDKNYDVIRNELLRSGAIEDMALSNFKPTQMTSGNIGFSLKGKAPNSLPWFGTLNVSYDFGHTVGWKVLQGRDFSRSFAMDSSSIILNDTAAKQLGIKNPIGQVITYNGNIFEDNKDHVIVGVVDNMMQDSPYEPPVPVMFFCGNWNNVITIRLNRNLPAKESLSKIEGVFKIYNPASPFEYQFNDESYAEKFSNEQRIGNLATVFAILAVFISCLGLFGLASFVAEQRTKEIGVRKVLGASIFNLWRMLSKDFVMLVIIACLIAGPLAWYFLHKWLQGYQYRTDISWWIFAAAGGGALVITLLTISFQAIKAALMNPVKSLRSE